MVGLAIASLILTCWQSQLLNCRRRQTPTRPAMSSASTFQWCYWHRHPSANNNVCWRLKVRKVGVDIQKQINPSYESRNKWAFCLIFVEVFALIVRLVEWQSYSVSNRDVQWKWYWWWWFAINLNKLVSLVQKPAHSLEKYLENLKEINCLVLWEHFHPRTTYALWK